MKTNSLLKYLMGFILFAGIFVSGNIKAQSVDATGTFNPVRDTGIVYAGITFVDGDNDGVFDCSIVLSEPAIAAWGDYSAAVAVYSDRLTVRNGGGWVDAGTVENLVVPVPNQVYHFWFDLDVTAKTYTTWVQTAGMAEPVKIFTDAAFRNTNIESILRWSALHNPDAEPDTVKVLKVAQVEAVGITGNYAMSLPGGADGSLSNVDISGLGLTTLPYTVEMWVNSGADQIANAGLIFNRPGNFGFQYTSGWQSTSQSVRYMAAGGEQYGSNSLTPDVSQGTWHHLAVVMTETTRTVYFDGIAAEETATFTPNDFSAGNTYIGWDSGAADRAFNGLVDEVRVWNVAKTSEDITAGKFQLLKGDEDGLVAYYNFNDTAEMATDLTVNANNGTINGGTYVESNYMDLSVAAPVVSMSETVPVMVEIGMKGYPVYVTTNNTDAALGIKVPEGFSVTPSSLTAANYDNGQAKLMVNVTTAAAGDSGSIVITFDGKGIDSIGVEAVEPYQRYFLKEAESGLLLGSASSSDAQPALTDSMNVAAQHFMLRPVNEGVDDSLYYIIQDVNYSFFSKKSSSGWSTKFGTLEDGVWKVVKGVTDYYTFMNMVNDKYCGADGTTADSWYYADKTGAAVDSFMMIEAPVAVIPAVLAHSYTFEEADTVIDVVGGLNGTLVGDKITVADGKVTVSGATTNTDGYITFDAAALALHTYKAVTLEAYVETGNTLNTWYTMLAYFGNNNGGSRCFWIQPTRDGNESRIETNNGSATVTAALPGTEIDDGEFHHVVAVLSPDSLQYYLDGVLVSSAALNGDFISTLDTEIAQLFKGPNGWADPNYNASLTEFNIYNGIMYPDMVAARAEEAMSHYGPKKVAYVQKSGKTVVATAADPYNDPI
ncbi:LamG domain-containing protein, partial [Saccharicrinis sp. FJH62]|uniref:LamG domain-containing protein n=1 Tax=Saccharicrinis sp. FJH62 TaxID=3344657 RepID=UPI0035D40940